MTTDANHELYKDFLEYAVEQGLDLAFVQVEYDKNWESYGMDSGAADTTHDFEEMMYDFLGVQSVEDDDRLYPLLEAPGIYEINHPHNFRSKD